MPLKILLCVILLVTSAGCATMQKKTGLNQQVQELQTQVDRLENEVQQKDDTIRNLEGELEKIKKSEAAKLAAMKKLAVSDEVTPLNIQVALKNANLYDGPIDGKIGKKTKKAIKEFQELNGFKIDGIVGKKTWAKLKEFLY